MEQWEGSAYRRPPPADENEVATSSPAATRAVEYAVAWALSSAFDRRETRAVIAEHSARVTALACAIAVRIDVRGTELRRLRAAAQLHEVGMVAVPGELLTRPGGLSGAELRRVRSQALVGAEIVRPTSGLRTARIVERQYDDFTDLYRTLADSREILIAGILRVADVVDAMTVPRPYQPPVSADRRRDILRAGSGSKFHPAAVHALLQMRYAPAVR